MEIWNGITKYRNCLRPSDSERIGLHNFIKLKGSNNNKLIGKNGRNVTIGLREQFTRLNIKNIITLSVSSVSVIMLVLSR